MIEVKRFDIQTIGRVLHEPLPINLKDGRSIVGLHELGAGLSAQWMGDVLHQTYGRHNLSASVDQIQQNFETGRLRPVFIEKEGRPDACAALVFSPHTIEIGRAANATEGSGASLLMRRLIEEWKQDTDEHRPLVAETRMAALLCPEKVGMIPHAFLPAFHHPGPFGPDRQELFGFLSLEKESHKSVRVGPAFIALPNRPEVNIPLIQSLLHMNGFETQICTEVEFSSNGNVGLSRKFTIPFNLLALDEAGNGFDFEENQSPFDLLPLSTFDPHLSAYTDVLIENGFICAGISAPHDGPLNLLFGRLRKTILAPTEPMRNFPGIPQEMILQVHEQFAQKMS